MNKFEKTASNKVLGRKLDELFEDLRAQFAPSIETTTQINMFVAQLAHETGGFKWMYELGGTKYLQYLEGRLDLGNNEPGDGVRYKGRGLIQITGKYNYKKYGDLIGEDLIANPDKAAEPETAMKVAMTYWERKGLAKYEGDVRAVTLKVNGGTRGLQDRIKLFEELEANV